LEPSPTAAGSLPNLVHQGINIITPTPGPGLPDAPPMTRLMRFFKRLRAKAGPLKENRVGEIFRSGSRDV
jgi:hypothetical protein